MKKTALVTGGSSGLGLALAQNLGKQGYNIVIVARNQEKINKAVESLKAMGVTAKGISCDITNEVGLKEAANQVKAEFTNIDYLVLNAGSVTTKLVSDYTSGAEMKQDLEVDLWGTILSAHIFLPLLKSG